MASGKHRQSGKSGEDLKKLLIIAVGWNEVSLHDLQLSTGGQWCTIRPECTAVEDFTPSREQHTPSILNLTVCEHINEQITLTTNNAEEWSHAWYCKPFKNSRSTPQTENYITISVTTPFWMCSHCKDSCWCVVGQQEHEDTQVKLHSQSQAPKHWKQSSSERSVRPAGCVLRRKICATVLCGDIIRVPVILPCDLWSLRAHKGGQRRVWRMSCLFWILTGAGNVGHTRCECPRRKGDRFRKKHLYSYSSVDSMFCDSSLLLYCWQLMGRRWQVRHRCHVPCCGNVVSPRFVSNQTRLDPRVWIHTCSFMATHFVKLLVCAWHLWGGT